MWIIFKPVYPKLKGRAFFATENQHLGALTCIKFFNRIGSPAQKAGKPLYSMKLIIYQSESAVINFHPLPCRIVLIYRAIHQEPFTMQTMLLGLLLISWSLGCQNAASVETTFEKNIPVADSPQIRKDSGLMVTDTPILQLVPYSNLELVKKEVLHAAPGTKSVLFNTAGTKLYAMNLEGMSVYEFDQATKKVEREFKFKATKGTGWNYATERPIPSFQEKPVEACFSHDDKILWVSLHNAEGIVPIFVNDLAVHKQKTEGPSKLITLYDLKNKTTDSFRVPLIKTGATPKVIARTANSRHLLVSNWHSHSISVLELDATTYPYGKVISDIKVPTIPRGIVIDDRNGKSYVTQMGGAELTVIDNNTWTKDTTIPVASNPRHVVIDSAGRLFVSYNKLAQVAAIDAKTGHKLFSAYTAPQPRTIILSKNQRFLFATCYSGNKVDVLKINDSNFEKLFSLDCKGSPVGVEIYEDNDKLEAWVCSYSNGAINVYTFKKKR